MNNEIKEILDNLKDEVWSKTGADSYDKLLDYITNLQQENNNLKTSLDESQEVVIDLQQLNLSLAKENEQEKQFIKDCGFENGQQLVLDYIGIRQEKEDYKSRIEKTVEIINLIKPELWNISNKMTYRLIDIENILNGRSDE